MHFAISGQPGHRLTSRRVLDVALWLNKAHLLDLCMQREEEGSYVVIISLHHYAIFVVKHGPRVSMFSMCVRAPPEFKEDSQKHHQHALHGPCNRGQSAGPLYAETEDLLPQESEAAQSIKLHHIFGATEDDMSKLRIVSLYEVRCPPGSSPQASGSFLPSLCLYFVCTGCQDVCFNSPSLAAHKIL